MRVVKFRYKYSDGENWRYNDFSLAEILNGDPMEVLNDNPLLKGYKMIGQEIYTGFKTKDKKEIYTGDYVANVHVEFIVYWDAQLGCFMAKRKDDMGDHIKRLSELPLETKYWVSGNVDLKPYK